jgi:hypothetical protein
VYDVEKAKVTSIVHTIWARNGVGACGSGIRIAVGPSAYMGSSSSKREILSYEKYEFQTTLIENNTREEEDRTLDTSFNNQFEFDRQHRLHMEIFIDISTGDKHFPGSLGGSRRVLSKS